MSRFSQRTELYFSKKFDETKGNLIKMNQSLNNALDRNGEIIIEGDEDNQIIVNTPNQSFSLKKINISTTFLVVNSSGIIEQQCCEFIQLEHYDPPYSEIYLDIAQQKDNIQFQNMTFQQCLGSLIVNRQQIMKKWKISSQQFEKFANNLNLKKLTSQSLNQFIYLPKRFAAFLMREFINSLLHKNNLQEELSYHLVQRAIPLLKGPILNAFIDFFQIQTKKQGQNHFIRFDSIIISQFIYLQMYIAKKQYTKTQFNEIFEEMMCMYLPAQCQQNRNNQKLYLYFIQKDQSFKGYDHFLMQPNLMERLKSLSIIKKKWRYQQLKAIFRGLPTIQRGKQITFQELLQKKFRKFGQLYQIRMILPH